MKVETASELLDCEFPDKTAILGPWMTQGTISMVHAYRGVGKTFFALQCAFCASAGGEFLGWKSPSARSVIYFDGEMGRAAMRQRLITLINSNNYAPEGDMLGLHCFDHCNESIMWDLSDLSDQKLYSEAAHNFDVIIIDNLATCVKSRGNETDTTTWARVQPWLIEQRSKGKTILLVHHSGKAMTQRGTSTKEDILDNVINLRRTERYGNPNTMFELIWEKTRGLCQTQAEALFVEMEPGDKCFRWLYQPIWRSRKHQVKAMLSLGLKEFTIATELGMPMSQVRILIRELEGENNNESTDASAEDFF